MVVEGGRSEKWLDVKGEINVMLNAVETNTPDEGASVSGTAVVIS